MSQKVLAIDDSQEIHQLLGVRLRGEGVTLHHALDGEQGLKMARELQPDLILLDIDMPDHTGFEVCQKLKSDPQTECLQVIFLTAADQVFAKVQGFDLGAIDYITKPFESAELRARAGGPAHQALPRSAGDARPGGRAHRPPESGLLRSAARRRAGRRTAQWAAAVAGASGSRS